MLANMASSLILHKRVNTTLAKAKALRVYVEPLITRSKVDSTHSRRVVFSYLQNKEAVSELFREVSVKVADRPGGYTRILKTGTRLGDNAEMALIELVDYNEALLEIKEEKKAKPSRRRRRSSGKKKVETPAEAKPVTEEITSEVDVAEESSGEAEVTEESSGEVKQETLPEDVSEEHDDEASEEPSDNEKK
jgi:large subunit ribosomal protein L17